ncbi:hypothetical protein [Novosphingobium sp.]|uniref:hypothetical protein n=1 Tax=Novosphingobium sp. TaxID=1874826 RepID=UPI0025DB73A0|nr:hypothetical protein [Novosphingobium sp.]
MTEAERHLADDRAIRREARANVKAGVTRIKQDLAARSISKRMIDKAKNETTETLAAGIEIAADNKAVIGAIFGITALWFLRTPALRWLAAPFARNRQADVHADYGIAGEHEAVFEQE